jgi:phosphoserine phosphatase RsbU/P
MHKTGIIHELFSAVREIFQQTIGRTSLRRDLESIYQFYLSSKEREQLAAMSPPKRTWFRVLWFLKSILLKLSPARRFLLIIALFLLLAPNQQSRPVPAFIVLFLILLLELKDKLLAHDELRAGQAVQAALRPNACPGIAGWDVFFYTRSANHVGGDLIDCFEVKHDQFAFTMGDVSGKGLAAALLMAQLQASVHALAFQNQRDNSLPALVSQLNRLYCRAGLANSFISFIFLLLEPSSGVVRFANAGHLPPLLISNRQVRELGKGGPAFGLMEKAKYNEETVTLQKNESLFIYTDGVTEARNELGDFYGEERLWRNLREHSEGSARALGEKIVSYLDVFIGQMPRSDDATLLILKRTE